MYMGDRDDKDDSKANLYAGGPGWVFEGQGAGVTGDGSGSSQGGSGGLSGIWFTGWRYSGCISQFILCRLSVLYVYKD